MYEKVNSERKKTGVAPVAESKVLAQKARARAKELCDKKQWSHEGWLNAFKGTTYKTQGENLAKGYKSDSQAHKALMNSITHKANILNSNFKNVGISKYKCKTGKKSEDIVVELFGG